jgi:hypothetical protein
MFRSLAAGVLTLCAITTTAQALDLETILDKTSASLETIATYSANADIAFYSG